MNEPMDPFEQRLCRQPMKAVPADWRSEILSAARAAEKATAQPAAVRAPWYIAVGRELLVSAWPNSKVWAGLAAVWAVIAVVNFSMRDTDTAPVPVVAEKAAPATPERIAELREQQRMFAELAGLNTAPDADRPKKSPLQPHSQRAGWVTI